jgi:hypothetical protein
MEIPISRSGFEGQNLSVETAGFFRGARVLQNGNPVERRKGRFSVRSNTGEEVLIQLKGNFLDPIPKVIFGNEAIALARPLTWYEYVWIGLPVLLVFTGGGLGALIGIAATYTSAQIFRSNRSVLAKYGITALVSIIALIAFMILAVIVQKVIGGIHH